MVAHKPLRIRTNRGSQWGPGSAWKMARWSASDKVALASSRPPLDFIHEGASISPGWRRLAYQAQQRGNPLLGLLSVKTAAHPPFTSSFLASGNSAVQFKRRTDPVQ